MYSWPWRKKMTPSPPRVRTKWSGCSHKSGDVKPLEVEIKPWFLAPSAVPLPIHSHLPDRSLFPFLNSSLTPFQTQHCPLCTRIRSCGIRTFFVNYARNWALWKRNSAVRCNRFRGSTLWSLHLPFLSPTTNLEHCSGLTVWKFCEFRLWNAQFQLHFTPEKAKKYKTTPEKWCSILYGEPYQVKNWYGFNRVCRIGFDAYEFVQVCW